MRRARIALAFLVPFAACDGGPIDPLADVDPIPGGRTLSLPVGSAGGHFVLGMGGASITLRIPAGALADTTTIAIVTRDATPAQRFQIVFEPAGLLFAKPIDVIVQLPPKDRVAAGGTLLYDGVPLAPLSNVNGALSARIRGFAEESFVDLRAGFRATPPTMANTPPALTPCMGWGTYTVDEFVVGTLTAADEVSNTLYWQCAQANAEGTWETGDFGPAMRLADATDAFLHRIANGASSERLPALATYSCQRLGAAAAALRDSTVTAFGQLPRLVDRVRFLALHGVQLEPVAGICPNYGTNLPLIDVRVDQALAFYATRAGQVASTNAPEYEAAVQEAVRVERAIAELTALGASPALVAHATAMARDRVHPALLDILIPPAFAACQAGNTQPLVRLVLIMGPKQRLLTALQDCQAP